MVELFVVTNPLNTGVCIKFERERGVGGGVTSKWQDKHNQTLGTLGHEVVLKFLKCLFFGFLSFVGCSQVLMGVVPKDTPFLSNQSCKSVCPLAIANCKEDRYVVFKFDSLVK